MGSRLPEEVAIVAQNQVFLASQFHETVLAEAEKVNQSIINLREMIEADHNEGPDKSFLKTKLEAY